MLKGAPKSSRDDPNFVESFFSASRLHFIGMWKTRLESLMLSGVMGGPAPTPGPGAQVIFHVDLDCFFASVAEAEHPLFSGKPLAVCHSNNAKGTAEISSANYEARKYGIRAGMFMAGAKQLCPDLIVVPYNFERYQEVSEQAYKIMMACSACVQPLSCDEAFLDVTGLGDPSQLAIRLRADIQAATGCTASVGIGHNLLIARLATKRAKPDGQCHIQEAEAASAVLSLELSDLPGVGWATSKKLASLGLQSVADLQAWSKARLQAELGDKTGAALWDASRGIDTRRVAPPAVRKSLGAEVNWGVRFDSPQDATRFLGKLAEEVWTRMGAAGVQGRSLTLKLKKRKEGIYNPVKFMGHGICDNLSRTHTFHRPAHSAATIHRAACDMLTSLRVPHADIRGIGLGMSKLEKVTDASHRKGSFFKAPAPAGSADRLPRLLRAASDLPGRQGEAVDHKPAEDLGRGMPDAGRVDCDASAPSAATGAGRSSPDPAADDDPSGKAADLRQLDAEDSLGWSSNGEGEGGEARLSPSHQELPADHAHGAAPSSLASEGSGHEGPAVTTDMARDRRSGLAQRAQVLASFQGMALSQIDAETLAALPWDIQRELVTRLPRNSEAAPREGVEAVTPQPDPPAANRGAWGTPGLAQGSPVASYEAVNVSLHTSSIERVDSPVVPLPSVSKLDPAVLAELPWHLRRELEVAYGPELARQSLRGANMRRTGRPAGSKPGPASGPKRGPTRPPSRTEVDAPHTRGFKRGQGGSVAEPPLQRARHMHHLPSSTTVDPRVLAELPPEIAEEILSAFPRGQRARLSSAMREGARSGGVQGSHAAPGCRGGESGKTRDAPSVMNARFEEYLDTATPLLHLPAALLRAYVELGDGDGLPGSQHGVARDVETILHWRLLQGLGDDLEGVAATLRSATRAFSGRGCLEETAIAVTASIQAAAKEVHGAQLWLGSILN
ncbi:REV1 [Auxenochlorella protothecoides x Auxenochlorella symbiontica]